LPATLDKTELCAQYFNGKKVIGEPKIPQPGRKINKVYLQNKNVKAYNKAVEAIKSADIIIFGPGSLYTSVIPNLLIKGISKAVRENVEAINIYICNSSTERGETENYTVTDHIQAIFDHCGGRAFDYCLVNSKVIKKSKDTSRLGSVHNITTNEEEILGCKIISRDLIDKKRPLYHDSDKLAKAVIEMYNDIKK